MTATKIREKQAQAPKTPKAPRHSKPEQHIWQAWGSDERFQVCSCGATRRADYTDEHGQTNPNPCVQRWGPGPKGAQCKTCAHLRWTRQAKTYYKCALRADLTHGARTDQRVRWDACKRYELRLLPGELRPDVADREIEARGASLASYMAAFHEAKAELDAHKPVMCGQSGRQPDERA